MKCIPIIAACMLTFWLHISFSQKIIVEFQDSYYTHQRLGKRQSYESMISDFHLSLTHTHGMDVNPRFHFEFPSFKGATFEVKKLVGTMSKRGSLGQTTGDVLKYLKSLPEVKNAWIPRSIKMDKDFSFPPRKILTDDPYLELNVEEYKDTLWSAHEDANVDKVQQLGFYGDGKVVAILDSGIDYMHPALGGGIGEGYKVVGGFNYINDSATGENAYPPVVLDTPSPDPMDCFGHGTLVAGIIAGNSSRLKGVAPNAQLRAYRVFDCEGETTEELVLAALKQAVIDKVDVINLSLGSTNAWSRTPLARMASDITRENGIAVVSSAGNQGFDGLFTGGNFGAGEDVLSVGSVIAEKLISYDIVAEAPNGDNFDFQYISSNGSQTQLDGIVNFQVVNVSTCDLASALSEIMLEDGLAPANVVLPKGDCDIDFQSSILEYMGVRYAIMYNTPEANTIFYQNDYDRNSLDVLFVPESFGQWINSLPELDFENSINIVFNGSSLPRGYSSGTIGPRMDNTSSWGPTYDNKFFPSVAAPGGYIYTSAYNVSSQYTVTRGTSFSAPYVSGVAALYLQSRDKIQRSETHAYRNPALEFNSKIIGTSNFVRGSDGNRRYRAPQPVTHQGAGLIDALAMIQGPRTQIISSPVLSLNDSRFRVSEFEIEIQNGNEYEVTYDVSNSLAATVHAKNLIGVPFDTPYPPQLFSVTHTYIFPERFTLRPGDTQKVSVTFHPVGISARSGYSFGGKILFAGNNGDTVGVPYMGKCNKIL